MIIADATTAYNTDNYRSVELHKEKKSIYFIPAGCDTDSDSLVFDTAEKAELTYKAFLKGICQGNKVLFLKQQTGTHGRYAGLEFVFDGLPDLSCELRIPMS